MKKINFTLLIVMLVTCFACNTETKIDTVIQEKNTKKPFTDYSQKSYKGQLSYLKDPGDEDPNELSIKYNFEEKIRDKNTNWEYFDKIYSDDLSITNKQHLAYIILSTKDLIGIYNAEKSNQIIEKRLIFYTKVLVDSDYIGYCLLYYSFDALKQKYPDLVDEFKNKVVNYSIRDDFHEKTINDKGLEKSEMALFYKKVKENYSYLEKIKNLDKK